MKTTHRNYSEAAGDFNRLSRFLMTHNDHVRARSTWSIGRLVDWKYGLYENKRVFPAFCDQNAHLWFDGFDELAGFVVSEYGGASFDIITLEGYRCLYAELLEWALGNWGSRGPRLATEITDCQALETGILERHGFRRAATFYTRRFDLTGELAERYLLEPGFSVVDMQAYPDYRAQRILRDNAFQDKDERPEEELQQALRFYNYSHEGPIYHAPTDLCVMAPDGRFVAGCEALIDAWNAEVDIERVCTHSAFRRRGFARAAIQECLYRLRDMGLRNAYITGYSPAAIALYGSLGAVDESSAFVYEMDAPAG